MKQNIDLKQNGEIILVNDTRIILYRSFSANEPNHIS
jgi:hypothetical protein